MLETVAQGADHFRAGFADCLELRAIDALDVLAQVVENLGQLMTNVLTVYPRIGRVLVVGFQATI